VNAIGDCADAIDAPRAAAAGFAFYARRAAAASVGFAFVRIDVLGSHDTEAGDSEAHADRDHSDDGNAIWPIREIRHP